MLLPDGAETQSSNTGLNNTDEDAFVTFRNGEVGWEKGYGNNGTIETRSAFFRTDYLDSLTSSGHQFLELRPV